MGKLALIERHVVLKDPTKGSVGNKQGGRLEYTIPTKVSSPESEETVGTLEVPFTEVQLKGK